MNTKTSTSPHDISRALVLGGGAALGNAWLIGVIAGLCDAGLDVTDADLVIGTSAGSTAAAMITSASPVELFAGIAEPATRTSTIPAGRAAPATPSQTHHLQRLQAIIDAAQDPADLRRRIGAVLPADPASDRSAQARWRATVAGRLPSQDWPQRSVLLTAVDADTGEPVVFDRHSGVELVDAVAASCSNGFAMPAYALGDRRYLDGGYRANENADLAAGHDRVLVLSPLGGRSLTPPSWGTYLGAHVDELRATGSEVETVLPDAASLAVFGDNMMNLSARPQAARAGFDQGTTVAGSLREFWS